MQFQNFLDGALAPIVTGSSQATGSVVLALLVGAAIALVAALSDLLIIRNKPTSLGDRHRQSLIRDSCRSDDAVVSR
jgi:hypothetical protein